MEYRGKKWAKLWDPDLSWGWVSGCPNLGAVQMAFMQAEFCCSPLRVTTPCNPPLNQTFQQFVILQSLTIATEARRPIAKDNTEQETGTTTKHQHLNLECKRLVVKH